MGGLFEFESTDENELNGNETPLRSKKQIVDHRQSILMELQNSLNDPSLIESTPLVTNAQLKTNRSNGVAIANHQFHKKKLSRLALDNNFSPIVFHVSRNFLFGNYCFVHSIFSSFGFWYFGHFSCVIFFLLFPVSPILPCKI